MNPIVEQRNATLLDWGFVCFWLGADTTIVDNGAARTANISDLQPLV
jgi:hypothetical protein